MSTANPAAESETDSVADTPVRHSPIVVQNLSRDLVRAYLQAEDYRFWTDQSGDFLVEFRYSDRVGGALTMGGHLEGASEDILSISSSRISGFITPACFTADTIRPGIAPM